MELVATAAMPRPGAPRSARNGGAAAGRRSVPPDTQQGLRSDRGVTHGCLGARDLERWEALDNGVRDGEPLGVEGRTEVIGVARRGRGVGAIVGERLGIGGDVAGAPPPFTDFGSAAALGGAAAGGGGGAGGCVGARDGGVEGHELPEGHDEGQPEVREWAGHLLEFTSASAAGFGRWGVKAQSTKHRAQIVNPLRHALGVTPPPPAAGEGAGMLMIPSCQTNPSWKCSRPPVMSRLWLSM